MGEIYCIYDNDKYVADVEDNTIEITRREYKNGFENYVDVAGNVHDDIFIKYLKLKDVSEVYEEDVQIKYNNNFFELYGDKIFKKNVLENSYMIYTNSEELASKYGFEKKEQFVFYKYITLEMIEAIRVVRTYIKPKRRKEMENILQGKEILNYLEKIE